MRLCKTVSGVYFSGPLMKWLVIVCAGLVCTTGQLRAKDSVSGVDVTVTIEGRKQQTEALSLVRARSDIIWKVITDFDRHEEFMPNVVESRIVFSQGNTLVVYKQLRIALQKIVFTLDVTLDEIGYKYSWDQREGPFKINRGSWILFPLGDYTRVYYTTLIEPKFYMPAWIKKLLVRKTVPELFKAIEKRALKMSVDKKRAQ